MLTSPQIRSFEDTGFLSGIHVADEADVASLRAAFDRVEASEGREKCQKGLFDPHLSEQFVWDLATDARILDRVEPLLGPNLLLMGTHFFCKYGPTEAFVAWHQDVTYWGLDPALAVSAWYAVDDSDSQNGCMQVIPRTHREGIRDHGTSDVAGNLLSINQELHVPEYEAQRATNIELKAGEISLHHGLIIHGSQPNRSTRRRCGLAMVYLPTRVRQVQDNSLGGNWHALLVRGRNEEGHFENRPHPFPRRAAPAPCSP